MEKFPADICTAETKTNGNPNILNDPMFAPPKKINMKEIFGTPSAKKSISPKKKRKFAFVSCTKSNLTIVFNCVYR